MGKATALTRDCRLSRCPSLSSSDQRSTTNGDTLPPGCAWFDSKLGPAEPDAGMIAELYRGALRDERLPSE